MKLRLPIRKPMPLAKRPPKLKLKASVARSRRAPLVVEEEDEFLEEPEPNMKLSHAFVVVLVLHVIAVAGVFAFNSIKVRQEDKVFAGAEAAAPTTEAAPAVTESLSVPAVPATGPAAITEPAAATTSSAPAKPAPVTPTAPAGATAAANARTHTLQPGETLTKVAAQFGVTVAALQQANAITDPTKIPAGTSLVIPEGSAPAASAPVAFTPVAKPAAASAKPAAAATPVAAAPGTTARDSGETYVVAKGDNPVKIAKKLQVSYADLMAVNGNPDPRKLQIGQKLKVPAKN